MAFWVFMALVFLSTPSVRRATSDDLDNVLTYEISIHALREEGDDTFELIIMDKKVFLSTPSVRRAT